MSLFKILFGSPKCQPLKVSFLEVKNEETELSNDAAGLTSPISSRFKSCRGYPSVNLLHVFSKYLPCEVRYVLKGPKQLL